MLKKQIMDKAIYYMKQKPNKWVIFSKSNARIKEMISVHIKEAKGITLHGELIQDLEEAA